MYVSQLLGSMKDIARTWATDPPVSEPNFHDFFTL
jgi:hypothetical protein